MSTPPDLDADAAPRPELDADPAHPGVTIPQRWEDATAEWFTAVLQQRFPGTEVGAADLLWATDGSNRRARFGLRHRLGQGPAVVFVKAEGAHRDVHARNGNLFNEPRLLGSGVALPIDHAEAYAVLVDEPAQDWLVVMEDVTERGGDPRDATRPLTVAQATAGVRGLARLHRRFWGGTDHPELAWLQTWAPTEGFQVGLRRRTPEGLRRAGGDLPASVAALDGDAVVDLWARYVALLGREPTTLLHADAHIGNCYVLPGDDVGFVDWQVARRGSWSQDVGHFLQGALTQDDRRSAERDVVAAYLDELDVGLDLDQAWTWYRASAAYGLAIWLSTLGTDGYQSREVSQALARRFAVAFDDLDATDALVTLERTTPQELDADPAHAPEPTAP